MADLDTLREGWDRAAREGAMFHILSWPDKEWHKDEFFATGRKEIAEALRYLASLGMLLRHRLAIDFGCGVGRLTQSLAGHYGKVVGVDISSEMLRRAREWCDLPNVRFDYRSDLKSLRPGADLIYSAITLQHMPPDLQRGYVQDFIPLLSPEGIALFQLPEGQTTGGNDFRSMYGTPRSTVEGWIEEAGGKVIAAREVSYTGGDWTDWEYAVVRCDT